MLLISHTPATVHTVEPVLDDQHSKTLQAVMWHCNTEDEIKRRKPITHAAAWALKQALWIELPDGSSTGKIGRAYRPDVVAMLATAYPLAPDAGEETAKRVKVRRAKFYALIDTTTAEKLGQRADRCGERNVPRIKEPMLEANPDMARILALAGDAKYALHKRDIEVVTIKLEAIASIARQYVTG